MSPSVVSGAQTTAQQQQAAVSAQQQAQQILNAESALLEADDESATSPSKTRLRRVACVCPNCREGGVNVAADKNDPLAVMPKKRLHICHIPGCNKTYGKTSHLRAHLRLVPRVVSSEG